PSRRPLQAMVPAFFRTSRRSSTDSASGTSRATPLPCSVTTRVAPRLTSRTHSLSFALSSRMPTRRGFMAFVSTFYHMWSHLRLFDFGAHSRRVPFRVCQSFSGTPGVLSFPALQTKTRITHGPERPARDAADGLVPNFIRILGCADAWVRQSHRSSVL